MNPPSALSVSAVVSFLREVLEANEFFSDLWIQGEVSELLALAGGHRYFSLKDANAARTVLFRDNMSGFQLKDGERVIAHGRITIYPQRGNCSSSQTSCGRRVWAFSRRSSKNAPTAEAEGLFDPGANGHSRAFRAPSASSPS
ncbi:MAG: exodeoxyribonuclease VII large subunit [Dehalococcoidia bacterium]|nr:exodeoxyribonuclease VII large subunit [Dehalococcoidia bacterium]